MESTAALVLEVAMARVRYIDLAQHTGLSKAEFFGEAGFKTFEVYGMTLESDDCVRVMFYNDDTDDTECEGIAIPIGCVLEIDWLEGKPKGQTKTLHSGGSAVN